MSALNPMDDAVSRAINGHDAVEDLGSTTSLINRDLIRYARHIVCLLYTSPSPRD